MQQNDSNALELQAALRWSTAVWETIANALQLQAPQDILLVNTWLVQRVYM